MKRIAFATLLAVLSAAALADATKESRDTKAAASCHSTEAESHAGCCCCPGDEKHTSRKVQASADCAEQKKS